jgi:hypothetical protein
MGFYDYYQLLHSNSVYSYMFRLKYSTIVRESFSTEVRSLHYIIEWQCVHLLLTAAVSIQYGWSQKVKMMYEIKIQYSNNKM